MYWKDVTFITCNLITNPKVGVIYRSSKFWWICYTSLGQRLQEVRWLFQGPKIEPKFYSRSDLKKKKKKASVRRISLIAWNLRLWLAPCSNTKTLTKIQDTEHYGFTALNRLRLSGTATPVQIKFKLATPLLPLNIRLLTERGGCSWTHYWNSFGFCFSVSLAFGGRNRRRTRQLRWFEHLPCGGYYTMPSEYNLFEFLP